MTNLAAPTYIKIVLLYLYHMDETTVKRTKSAINGLLDVEQFWIDSAPEYTLSQEDIARLLKKLTKVRDTVDKIIGTVEKRARTSN